MVRHFDSVFYGTRIANLFGVARKFHSLGIIRPTADGAALDLRVATPPLPGLRLPPRVRKVPVLRRRVAVTAIAQPPQPVIIRHVRPNLGSAVSETQLIQSQRV